MRRLLLGLVALCLSLLPASIIAQASDTYIMHSSGLFLGKDASGDRASIFDKSSAQVKQLELIPNDDGTLLIAYPDGDGHLYLSLDGSWNASFLSDATSDNAHFTIETSGEYVKFRCKANNKYLGTDNTSSGSHVYADKDGSKVLHLWLLAQSKDEELPVDTLEYLVNTASRLQRNEGWGAAGFS